MEDLPEMKERRAYMRASSVPDIEGTKVKICKACHWYFAARPRQRRCDDCMESGRQRQFR